MESTTFSLSLSTVDWESRATYDTSSQLKYTDAPEAFIACNIINRSMDNITLGVTVKGKKVKVCHTRY